MLKEISHHHADEDSAVIVVLLYGAIRHLHEFDGLFADEADLFRNRVCLGNVSRWQGVIVESYLVREGDKQ